MPVKIIEGGLSSKQVEQLLQQHLDDMALHSPAESVHALDLNALRVPEISFYSLWDGGSLAGCAALKEIDCANAEIKSMRTTTAYLRQGVANQLLNNLIEVAVSRNYHHLWLETGSADVFRPARRLYEKYGFTQCDPFAEYVLDPYSVFMTKRLISS